MTKGYIGKDYLIHGEYLPAFGKFELSSLKGMLLT